MSDPTFVRTRHPYDSYGDLFRLVELSRFPTCYVDEMDAYDPARCYILPIRNGEVGEGWPDAKARIVHYNLEWDAYPPLAGVDETWSADKWFAEAIAARYVPMGSHPGLRLTENKPTEPLYDVAYLGYMVPRREQIGHDLIQAGVRVSPIHAWGEERDAVLNASIAYLHVHQREDAPGVPALRMVVAAAYGLPVISETCADVGIFEGAILTADYSAIRGYYVRQVLDSPILRGDLRYALHWRLCFDMPFRKSIEAAL